MSTAPTRVLDRERREELGDDDDEREGLGEDERDDGGDDEGDDENTNSDRVSVPRLRPDAPRVWPLTRTPNLAAALVQATRVWCVLRLTSHPHVWPGPCRPP